MKSVINLNLAFFALLLVFVVGCKKDDDTPPVVTGTDPVASFQYEVSATNFLEVSFSNFSQNETSYAWDFGDSNTSTEESPTHTYAAAGSYTVTLTVTGADSKTSAKSEAISIVDPNATATLLAGTSSKTWILQREGVALGIGQEQTSNGWWAFGNNTPLGDRPCILDDEYIFHADGTWEFKSNGTLWIDLVVNGGWLDPDTEDCFDENTTSLTSKDGDDLSAFGNGGDYTYDYDASANMLTINGLGAYIGLASKTSAGDNFIPQAIKTYDVLNLVDGPVADSLHLNIPIDGGAGGYWNFYLVSYDNPADTPPIPSAKPTANFNFAKDDFTVTFTNTSVNATEYTWDFGDGGMSGDTDPVHTYTAEGTYTVTLTAKDGNGESDVATQDIVISSAVFTAATLSSATGKVWKLNGEASYKVGSAPGAGDFWGGIDAVGVMDRACQMDDEFIFYDNGDFKIDTKGQVWAEGYMLGTNACMDNSALIAPYDVFGGGDFAFTGSATELTVNGLGAYIGFNKPFTGGELDNNGTTAPASTITYQVFEYAKSGNTEILAVAIDYVGDGCCYWTMTMISEN